MMKQQNVFVFDKPGPRNTDACIEVVQENLKRGIRHVFIATTSGETGLKMATTLQGTSANLVVV